MQTSDNWRLFILGQFKSWKQTKTIVLVYASPSPPNCLTPACCPPPAEIRLTGMSFMVVSFREYQRLCHVSQVIPLSKPYSPASFSVYLPPGRTRERKFNCQNDSMDWSSREWFCSFAFAAAASQLVLVRGPYPGSIFRSDVPRGICSSTSRSRPAGHSSLSTCRCLCREYWTACRCVTCGTCHWRRLQGRSRRRHRQHRHQSSNRRWVCTCQPPSRYGTCCNRHIYRQTSLVFNFLLPQFDDWICQISKGVMFAIAPYITHECVGGCAFVLFATLPVNKLDSQHGRDGGAGRQQVDLLVAEPKFCGVVWGEVPKALPVLGPVPEEVHAAITSLWTAKN